MHVACRHDGQARIDPDLPSLITTSRDPTKLEKKKKRNSYVKQSSHRSLGNLEIEEENCSLKF
jgi:hypothetical protein